MDLMEERLHQMGLRLPEPFKAPARLSFSMVRVLGTRVFISGHGPQHADGSLKGLQGRLGADWDVERGYQAARLTALSMLGSLKRELGSLDRVQRWGRVFGMVRCAPDFAEQPAVINGFSDLIIELYGQQRGQHARSAVGMAELPFGIPVEIEAELELAD